MGQGFNQFNGSMNGSWAQMGSGFKRFKAPNDLNVQMVKGLKLIQGPYSLRVQPSKLSNLFKGSNSPSVQIGQGLKQSNTYGSQVQMVQRHKWLQWLIDSNCSRVNIVQGFNWPNGSVGSRAQLVPAFKQFINFPHTHQRPADVSDDR